MLILLPLVLACALAQAAFADGYDVYAAPLAWSPDGRLLAAAVNAKWPRDYTLSEGALRLYGRNGEVVSELATGLCGSPSFSPDGKLLAAVVDGNLAIYEVATGKPWSAFAPAEGSPAAGGKVLDCLWRADSQRGSTLWYTAGDRFYGCACYTLDPATGRGDKVWGDDRGGSVLAPEPSPDARFLVALHQNAAGGGDAAYERLYVWPRDGQAKQATKSQLRKDDYHESNALFLDGHTVLFQRGGWGDWRLVRLDLATGKEYIEVPDAQQPALDGRGHWLAFARRDFAAKQAAEDHPWDTPSSVMVRDLTGVGEYDVSTPGVYAELPALTPDGARIAWLEQGRDGSAQVAIRTMAGLIQLGPGIAPGAHASAPPSSSAGDAGSSANPAAELPDPAAAAAAAQAALDGAPPASTMKPSNGATTMADNVTNVVFETTKGKLVLAVHADWAPVGAAHFLELVRDGFYNGAPWFRVIDGFVAQCGIAADPAVNDKWDNVNIQDDPVKQGNKRGFVAFGQTSLPNSRSTHIFINYGDNSRLDGMRFACFAEVVEGMDVADKFTRCEYQDQDMLSGPGGLDDFKRKFPSADFITKAYVEQ
jgi:peptidyl-prolyl cis-trans isomerase A (cyclophilin A)